MGANAVAVAVPTPTEIRSTWRADSAAIGDPKLRLIIDSLIIYKSIKSEASSGILIAQPRQR
jgi:hypothetical protein